MSVIVRYTDIAIGAKESFGISVDKRLPASNVELIKTEGATFKRYDMPFDLNSMILDGAAEFLPEDGLAEIGFISEQLSDENGDFVEPIVIEFISSETFASAGLTLRFDEIKNIYPTHIRIDWYNGDMLLDGSDFNPTSSNYFCNKKVEFYNKFVITFYSLSVPFNRLILNHVEYGLMAEFGAKELRSAKMIQEIDPISTSVPINTFDFAIDSKKNIEFSFQTRQPIDVIFNGEKRATAFVKSAKRKSKTMWDIHAEDHIGLMDSVYFKGGIYSNKNAVDLIDEIFSVAKVPYGAEIGFGDIVVSGYIPYTTCREALMQVIFAIGAVADTSNSDKVNIFALKKDITQEISRRRIMQGQNFEDETRVTAVELMSHSYNETNETLVAYEAEKSGTGNNIFVSFTNPLHDLTITSGSIVESGVNYAIINANSGCTLTGKKYEHTMVIHRKDNPLVLSTDIENVVAIEDATLISSNNIDKILLLCYNYIVNTEKINMRIIDGKTNINTKVGDLISYETEYIGKKTGRIIRQSFSLVGGMLVKDSVVR